MWPGGIVGSFHGVGGESPLVHHFWCFSRLMRRYDVDRPSAKENQRVPVTTSPDDAVRLFTIKEAAEVLEFR